jgi:hypothetical protein
MRKTLVGTALAGFMAVTMVAAQALTSGSMLNGTLNQNLSSNHAYVGEPVSLSNVTGGGVEGGTLYGYVSSVQKAGQGRPGSIRLHFNRLVGNGATYTVSTNVTNATVSTKNNALKEAGGALAGMLVGNAIGKTIFHTGIGGVVGAAGGFLLAKNNRQDVNMPAGTTVQVQVISVVRRQSHG